MARVSFEGPARDSGACSVSILTLTLNFGVASTAAEFLEAYTIRQAKYRAYESNAEPEWKVRS